eukprot:gene10635-10793_t
MLVVRGGGEGLLNAMQIVAECHAVGLLSPQQQLILQLEQAALQPQGSVISGYNVAKPSLSSLAGLPEPLSVIDVRDCSAIEGIVLVMSWLAELINQQATNLALPATNILTIVTGGFGPAPAAEVSNLILYQPTAKAQGAAQATSAAGNAAGMESKTGGADTDAALSSSATTGPPGPTSMPGGGNVTEAAGSASSAEIPGSNVSVHAAVVALLGGNLMRLLGCADAMDLLVPFSSAGQLPLGLLCCSALPVVLPEGHQGGGILLPVQDLSAAIRAAVMASRA